MALDKVRETPGLLGRANGSDHDSWKADFDFVTTESKFVKLMEGKYDAWGSRQSGPPSNSIAAALERMQSEVSQ